MRDRLRARQSGRLDLAPVARQQKISAAASALPPDEALLQRFVCSTGYILEKRHEDMAVLRKALAKYPASQLENWTWITAHSECMVCRFAASEM